MHSVTDRQADGQQDNANSRSYCVAVRSANKQTKYNLSGFMSLYTLSNSHACRSNDANVTGFATATGFYRAMHYIVQSAVLRLHVCLIHVNIDIMT